jgi:hypothetical protein
MHECNVVVRLGRLINFLLNVLSIAYEDLVLQLSRSLTRANTTLKAEMDRKRKCVHVVFMNS